MTMFFNNSFYIASHGAPINCFFRTFFLFIQNFYLSNGFLYSKIHFGVSKECATSWSHTSKHWLKIFDSPSKNTREEKEKEKKERQVQSFLRYTQTQKYQKVLILKNLSKWDTWDKIEIKEMKLKTITAISLTSLLGTEFKVLLQQINYHESFTLLNKTKGKTKETPRNTVYLVSHARGDILIKTTAIERNKKRHKIKSLHITHQWCVRLKVFALKSVQIITAF